MTKQTKQRHHREWMHKHVWGDLRYTDFGIERNKFYWYKIDNCMSEALLAKLMSEHPYPNLLELRESRMQYAPEIRSTVLILKY